MLGTYEFCRTMFSLEEEYMQMVCKMVVECKPMHMVGVKAAQEEPLEEKRRRGRSKKGRRTKARRKALPLKSWCLTRYPHYRQLCL